MSESKRPRRQRPEREPLMKPAEVADLFDVEPVTVVDWAKTGKIPATRTPGGQWRFVNRHPKGEAAFHGEIRELAPPERMVFTEIFEDFPDVESVVTSLLLDEGDRTRLIVTVRYPSKDVRDMVIASGMAKGAVISYDRLEDLVAELQRA